MGGVGGGMWNRYTFRVSNSSIFDSPERLRPSDPFSVPSEFFTSRFNNFRMLQ